jgi:crotonobetainyl-CoA:carnitine CoA-transferase CaiB-like acyl-CoA transferase
MLVDFGARVIKVEEPSAGDPLRSVAPRVGGVGAAFCAFFRGTESVGLDLRTPTGAAALRKLARHADVLVESFRPGTLAGWGLAPARLTAANPALVLCSLSGFGAGTDRVAHDLNVTAASGALSLIPGCDVPDLQLADVTTGLLAASAVLAALVRRSRTGAGCHIDQPLLAGALPYLTPAYAERAGGGAGLVAGLIAGGCPAYRRYRCADGLEIAVCALEPKFWTALIEILDLPELAGSALDSGESGRHAARRIEDQIATRPRTHWLGLAEERNLPISAVHDLDSARAAFPSALLEETPGPDGRGLSRVPGPYVPSLGRSPSTPAPLLGEHTDRVLREFGIERDAV